MPTPAKRLRATTSPSKLAPRQESPESPVDLLNALMCTPAATGQKDRWLRYFEPLPVLSAGLPAPMLGIMVLIWQLRDKDLQREYPLTTYESRLGFMAWCVIHGRKEYQSLRHARLFWDALALPADFPEPLAPDDAGHAISWQIALVAMERKDLGFDLTSPAGRDQMLAWYLLHGRQELNLDDEPLPDWQCDFLFAKSTTDGCSQLESIVYRVRADVRAAYPLPGALDAYRVWFNNVVGESVQRALPTRHDDVPPQVPALPAAPPFGVNVIGYAFGQLGIGEDARMAAKSLLTTSVPMTMVDFPPGAGVSNDDRSMEDHVSNQTKYAINLFCLTALEHARYFAERGPAHFHHRINIGHWPWELEIWPEEWKHALALVDEVWATSAHTLRAISSISTATVRHMPMAVEAITPRHLSRAEFGLPESVQLFLFSFDLNSSARRKNPEACIEAFLKAFPTHGDPSNAEVGLVIKVQAPRSKNSAWERLKKLQRRDPRVYFIEATLTKEEMLGLYRACDYFISLHRAEGFGRCIAEAMLLGKVVIATGYSGNLDFTNPSNSLLVPHTLVPLKPDDYPYGLGKQWAEPDTDEAAKLMHAIAVDSKRTALLGRRARRTISNRYSPTAVGRQYVTALQQIKAENEAGATAGELIAANEKLSPTKDKPMKSPSVRQAAKATPASTDENSSTVRNFGSYEGEVSVDSSDGLRGWVWDRQLPYGAVTVELLANEQLLATAVADSFDMELANRDIGNGKHAFSLTIASWPELPLPTELTVRIVGTTHVIGSKLIQTHADLTGIVASAPIGHADGVLEGEIRGWAFDRANPDTSSRVDIWDNENLIATIQCSDYRPDLREANLGSGYCGFSFPLPLQLLDGTTHTVTVCYAGTKRQLPNGTFIYGLMRESALTKTVSVLAASVDSLKKDLATAEQRLVQRHEALLAIQRENIERELQALRKLLIEQFNNKVDAPAAPVVAAPPSATNAAPIRRRRSGT